jgi:hypothetical protein
VDETVAESVRERVLSCFPEGTEIATAIAQAAARLPEGRKRRKFSVSARRATPNACR